MNFPTRKSPSFKVIYFFECDIFLNISLNDLNHGMDILTMQACNLFVDYMCTQHDYSHNGRSSISKLVKLDFHKSAF